MIQLLDEIVVAADSLPTLRALLHERYLPGAQTRNMQLAGEWVSPPVTVAGEPHTLWLTWQLPDIGAWWAMRQQASLDPVVEALWKDVDALCLRRARHVQIPASNAPATVMEPPHA
ncbi:hypothetical protein ACFQAT_16050 [Undibacterium arcticum]|jgi:hypothetical protein|uniref:Uncharacterized protein n=1 Tax=Undibacterium arcticum TaxID=1762892 RepID=A0ABV7EXC8_9BURK